MWATIFAKMKGAKDAATPHARYIGTLVGLLLFCAIAYWFRWRYLPPVNSGSPIANLPSTPTASGVPAYTPNQIPSAKPPKRTVTRTTRPVAGTPVINLPPVELNYVPSTLPQSAVVDNVVRETALIATAVVPPHKGDTDVRTYIDPQGEARTYLYPKRESFLGFDPLALELGAGYGIGASQGSVDVGYYPLRVGNFRVGAEARGWNEVGGDLKGAASIRVRWEPFRH